VAPNNCPCPNRSAPLGARRSYPITAPVRFSYGRFTVLSRGWGPWQAESPHCKFHRVSESGTTHPVLPLVGSTNIADLPLECIACIRELRNGTARGWGLPTPPPPPPSPPCDQSSHSGSAIERPLVPGPGAFSPPGTALPRDRAARAPSCVAGTACGRPLPGPASFVFDPPSLDSGGRVRLSVPGNVPRSGGLGLSFCDRCPPPLHFPHSIFHFAFFRFRKVREGAARSKLLLPASSRVFGVERHHAIDVWNF